MSYCFYWYKIKAVEIFSQSVANLERVAKFLRESILIAFDLVWKALLSDRNFATLLDPPLKYKYECHLSNWCCYKIFTFYYNGDFLQKISGYIFHIKMIPEPNYLIFKRCTFLQEVGQLNLVIVRLIKKIQNKKKSLSNVFNYFFFDPQNISLFFGVMFTLKIKKIGY